MSYTSSSIGIGVRNYAKNLLQEKKKWFFTMECVQYK